jgi:hypothetical protein
MNKLRGKKILVPQKRTTKVNDKVADAQKI